MSPQPARDTIAAIASPAGHGGVGVIRVSGPAAATMASALLGREPTPRLAHYCRWQDEAGAPIDQGLLLYFPAPRSYTGEDVLELQGHGGRVVLELLLQRVLALGARLARPGEFTERAFLEGKLDLAQAEAVADLITAGSASAARAALRSLDGVFSDRVDALLSELVALRVLLEAAIDFPDEEIDILSEGDVSRRLALLLQSVQQLLQEAERGQRLRDGLYLVILGPPNAGKSSLLNALAGSDRAIVTPIAGTTRDVLREALVLRGVPVTVVDTAGLRDSDDPIEAEGVRRAGLEAARADHALIVLDDSDPQADPAPYLARLPAGLPATVVRNKVDVSGRVSGVVERAGLVGDRGSVVGEGTGHRAQGPAGQEGPGPRAQGTAGQEGPGPRAQGPVKLARTEIDASPEADSASTGPNDQAPTNPVPSGPWALSPGPWALGQKRHTSASCGQPSPLPRWCTRSLSSTA
ncbi:MAG: tRNA uridine-5-carboxymethylaminomethyl(34) synthesis GTPase MnmE, partial [Lysobacterales bacterium]